MLNNNTSTVENQAVSLDNNTRTVEDQAVSLDNNMATVLGQNDSLECDFDTLPGQAGLLEDKNFFQKVLDKFKIFCQELEAKERYQLQVTVSFRTNNPNIQMISLICFGIIVNFVFMYYPIRYIIQNGPESAYPIFLLISILINMDFYALVIIRRLIDSCKEIENNDSELPV